MHVGAHVVQADILVRAMRSGVGISRADTGNLQAESPWWRQHKRPDRTRSGRRRRNPRLRAAYVAQGLYHLPHEWRLRVADTGQQVALVADAAHLDVIEPLVPEELAKCFVN